MKSKSSKNSNKLSNNMTLVVDSIDKYNDDNIYYVQPKRFSSIQYLQNNFFSKCKIQNSKIDLLTPFAFLNLFSKLKKNANTEIIIDQPVSVMQEYDARQVIANAQMAGFTNIKTTDTQYIEPRTQKKIDTLCVSFTKPEKKEFDEEKLNSIKENVITTKVSTTVKSSTTNPRRPEGRGSRSGSKTGSKTGSRQGSRTGSRIVNRTKK
jgi:hypothetical protein